MHLAQLRCTPSSVPSPCGALGQLKSLPNYWQASRRTSPGRTRHCAVVCSIKARWCIDIRYGVKMDAIALLQEWVQSIGSQAGLTAHNTTILSGAIGAPESRLELEIELDNLAQLESFWGQIPSQAHKAWSQRAQHFLVDGSPQWQVYRQVPVPATFEQSPAQGQSAVPPPAVQSFPGLIIPEMPKQPKELIIPDMTSDEMREYDTSSDQDASDEPETSSASAQEDVMLDWKGDPMVVNPGDKLPFNFR